MAKYGHRVKYTIVNGFYQKLVDTGIATAQGFIVVNVFAHVSANAFALFNILGGKKAFACKVRIFNLKVFRLFS
jgi:hypothetical protein